MSLRSRAVMPRPILLRVVVAGALSLATVTALTAHGETPATPDVAETTLYFHSANGGYQQDALADPAAPTEGRAPEGATLTTTAPTADSEVTARYQDGVLVGDPLTPTFSVPVSGTVRAVCFDVWLSARVTALNEIDLLSGFSLPDGSNAGLTNLSTAYDSSDQAVRMTAVAFPDQGKVTLPAGSTLTMQTYIDSNQGWALHYDSTAVPSSATINPATCAGVPVIYPVASTLPSADPQGLKFSATVPADPQRDEGEPAVTTDRDGTLYTCGPTGSSQMADYAQVSTDGGDQFHLLGLSPRGQISTPPHGGGDCALATAPERNADGNYQLAYAGLGPLTQFSTATSADRGRTMVGSPVSESIPVVDRQWIAFTDATTAFLTYNQLGIGKVVQKSTDGGLTYGPRQVIASGSGRIGQIRAFTPPTATSASQRYLYVPYNDGTKVNLALSKDTGATWSTCTVTKADVDPTAGFIAADTDLGGNVYVTYSEKGGGRDTYLVTVPFAELEKCVGGVELATTSVQVNRGNVATSLFPWVAAGGAPGRVAVAFYGTDQEGDPDSGEFQAAWNVYVSQVLNALDADPQVAQVQATTHPFHYDSICTAGLNCDINMADRSLVDYFTIEYNPAFDALQLVYSQTGKEPGETEGHVATPAVVTQVAGPSNGGSVVDRGFRTDVLRTSSPDPADDAISGYSTLSPLAESASPADAHLDALDLVTGVPTATGGKGKDKPKGGNGNGKGHPAPEPPPAVEVGPQVDLATGAPVSGGGFTVTMRLKNLSDDALNAALQGSHGGSLIYLFRFVDGYQAAGVSARWSPAEGWSFAYSGYDTAPAQCGSSNKCLIYPKDDDVQGVVDQQANTIRISVPLAMLKALGPADSAGRPSEVAATAGSRIYDATAFTLVNPSPVVDAQSFMEQVDNAPSFDFLIPS